MNRRAFITLLGGVAWPVAADGEQGEPMRRIGVLMGQGKDDPGNDSRIAAFEQALGKLGWSYGRTVVAEFRWGAGNLDRMQSYARELIGLRPDVVVAESTPAASALRRESQTVPIVFMQVGNPVGSGFVASLAHPEGKMTGFTNFEPAMGSKWLELLKEVAPHLARAAAIFNPETHSGQFWQSMESAAPSLAIKFIRAPAHDAAERRILAGYLVMRIAAETVVCDDPQLATYPAAPNMNISYCTANLCEFQLG
jgi:putative tryptophan/tyrosine transport system substrate-binding protein